MNIPPEIKDFLPSSESELFRILEARHTDPHSILGMHYLAGPDCLVIRVYDPMALEVSVIAASGVYKMTQLDKTGFFVQAFPGLKDHFSYKLNKKYAASSFESEDPYCFLPGVGDVDMYLFNEGEHRKVYEFMGAHPKVFGGVEGILFSVWAPNADRVSVVGNFNCWDGRRHCMRMMGMSGIWEIFIPRLPAGEIYKYEIRAKNGDTFLKLDPYAYRTELRPNNAAVVWKPSFTWSDNEWMEKRKTNNYLERPVNIYEVHLSSWRGPGLRKIENRDDFHNYRDIAHALADYVCEMGYTHVELLPLAEHPLDQSWGYQVTGFYSPTARFGSPDDFAYFVNYMHKKGIGVILDWVPAHFPKDAYSLGRFDGTALYEHADPRQGEHRDWGTYIFNYGRCEVRNFLMANALFWFDKYHLDGLRVDAVASMLYLNYSRNEGDWIPNKYGGKENLEAISFLKRLNELTHELYPGTMMVAEESTAWPSVSRPVYVGGLGFSCKWNMGWMHDVLEYFSLDPIYRSYNHGKLTFSLLYAFSENFILPLSHDEVVHGKCSLLSKMPGDYAQKFANLKALYGFMITHPGKKLLFMGGEFGQWIEWNSDNGLDWMLLDYPAHAALRTMVKDLNGLYKNESSLWEDDFTPAGFQWIECGDYQQSVVSYIRWDKKHQTPVVIILNLTPVVRDNYVLGVPQGGKWQEIFNSDNSRYGGTGLLNGGTIESGKGLYHGQPYNVKIRLPWLGFVILKPLV